MRFNDRQTDIDPALSGTCLIIAATATRSENSLCCQEVAGEGFSFGSSCRPVFPTAGVQCSILVRPGLSAVLCLLVWRGYRAQSCAFFFLVWRAYLAQRCIFFSGLEGIRGSAKRCTLSSSLAVWRGLGRTACRTRDAALSPRCRVFGGARVFLADIQHRYNPSWLTWFKT